MRLVQCKNCKKIYHGSLKKCPECETKTPPSTAKIVVGIILAVLGLFIFVGAVSNISEDPSTPSDNISLNSSSQDVDNKTQGKVNYENFEKIKNGMTYEEVVEIFGEEGKVISEVDVGMEEYATTMYYWYDHTGIANCNVTIQGGKVVAKAQVGLN